MLVLTYEGTQHRCPDLISDQIEIVVETFGKREHRVLGNAVDAHARRRHQSGHGGGVHDAALIGRVGSGGGEHARGKAAHTVGDAIDIDGEQPLPVLFGAFPDRPARRDTGIVEQQIGGTEALVRW
jgi:hypothetical protein